MSIHPTAIVAPGARLGEGVEIGPYAVIGETVTLGDHVSVGPNVVLTGRTTIGAGSRLHPGVVVGEPPQDFSYRGEDVSVEIGERCILREHVTVHAGTARGHARTVVGNDCFFMVGVHVGHDCIVGNSVTLSNNVLLAGHTSLGDYVLIGGGAAIVQRVRIGAYAFISGLSGVTKDVVPFAYVIGHRGRLDSLNLVGLKRRGFDRTQIRTLLDAYAILFAEEGLFRDRLDRLRAEMGEEALVKEILAFIDAGRNRPLLQPLGKHDHIADDPDLLEAGV
ncbi:acyl-ACP--UDP-N-acetylglucosamine O-acyltransferase [Acuticoccus sp. 2012]|uniref:Acyl-ACP--UDP-N-acetylglucosamine O-acyltransferase n=1 Tax=Acuticoccus mangrovi TaxID=2796142 RepID=A0A934IFH5_9HYPH|nr:acyl-ACP--UDP-N-acetylglucosamine O-acyltransferase [Acuticoccus mangrovi]MBJ3775548.1 acyl-ACP--UDP-N-acetylglucosamine O-acyltransferase [Acuticoccus mangrovi]